MRKEGYLVFVLVILAFSILFFDTYQVSFSPEVGLEVSVKEDVGLIGVKDTGAVDFRSEDDSSDFFTSSDKKEIEESEFSGDEISGGGSSGDGSSGEDVASEEEADEVILQEVPPLRGDGGSCNLDGGYVCDVADLLPETFAGCFGDADGNGVVNAGDRGFVAVNIGATLYDLVCKFDMDGNGFINAGDRGFVAVNIGLCTPLPDYQDGSGMNDGVPDTRFPQICGDGCCGLGEVCAEDGCSGGPICGNGEVEGNEQCDGGNLNGNTCQGLFGENFTFGDVTCNPDCTLDASECRDPLSCGNGIINPGEDCDCGPDLACTSSEMGNNDCSTIDFGFTNGTLICDTTICRFNLNQCYTSICGNGLIEIGEQCDGQNLDNETCQSLGYNDGNLTCGSSCFFNSTVCSGLACGNGDLDFGEQCDDGNVIGGDGCSSACMFEACGDGIQGEGEECEDGNLEIGDGCDDYCHIEYLDEIYYERANLRNPISFQNSLLVSQNDDGSFVTMMSAKPETTNTPFPSDNIISKRDESWNSCSQAGRYECDFEDLFVRPLEFEPRAGEIFTATGPGEGVFQTSDGGYVAFRRDISFFTEQGTHSNLMHNVQILKMDSNGESCDYFLPVPNAPQDNRQRNGTVDCFGESNGQNVFSQVIGGYGTEIPIGISQLLDGSYLVAVNTESIFLNNSNNTLVLKVNSTGGLCPYNVTGNCQDETSFSKSYNFNSAAYVGYLVDDDGGIILNYLTNDVSLFFVKVSPQGFICSTSLTGSCSSGGSFVTKINLPASLRYSYYTNIRSARTSDGGFILFSRVFFAGGEKLALIKTDPNGNTCTPNASGCSSGSQFIKFIDQIQILSNSFYTPTLRSVNQVSDGGYMFSFDGSLPPSDVKNIFVVKSDSAGNICDFSSSGFCSGTNTFVKKYGPIQGAALYSSTLTNDEGLLMVTSIATQINEIYQVIIKTNSSGDVVYTLPDYPSQVLVTSPIDNPLIYESEVNVSFNLYNYVIDSQGGKRIKVYQIEPADPIPYEVFSDGIFRNGQPTSNIQWAGYEKLKITNLEMDTHYIFRFVLTNSSGSELSGPYSRDTAEFTFAEPIANFEEFYSVGTGNSFINTSDGGYLFGGTVYPDLANQNWLVLISAIKLDDEHNTCLVNGILLPCTNGTSKFVAGQGPVSTLLAGGYYSEPTSDGGYILGGSTGIIKINSTGSSCSSGVIPCTGNATNAPGTFIRSMNTVRMVKEVSDGGFLVDSDTGFVKTSHLGNTCEPLYNCSGIVDGKIVFGIPLNFAVDFLEADGGYVAIVGGNSIRKITLNGTICRDSNQTDVFCENDDLGIWSKPSISTSRSLSKAQDGGYIVGGAMTYPSNIAVQGFLKTDSKGNSCGLNFFCVNHSSVDGTLLLNRGYRNIFVGRAKESVDFISEDVDGYLLIGNNGTLKTDIYGDICKYNHSNYSLSPCEDTFEGTNVFYKPQISTERQITTIANIFQESNGGIVLGGTAYGEVNEWGLWGPFVFMRSVDEYANFLPQDGSRIVIREPLDDSVVHNRDVIVDLKILYFTLSTSGGSGNHVELVLDNSQNSYEFYSDGVLWGGSPAEDADWLTEDSLRFNGLGTGQHFLNASIVNAEGVVLHSTAIDFYVDDTASVDIYYPSGSELICTDSRIEFNITDWNIESGVYSDGSRYGVGQHLQIYLDNYGPSNYYSDLFDSNNSYLRNIKNLSGKILLENLTIGQHTVLTKLVDQYGEEVNSDFSSDSVTFDVVSNPEAVFSELYGQGLTALLFYKGLPTSDGGFIFVGGIGHTNMSNRVVSFVVKTDSFGKTCDFMNAVNFTCVGAGANGISTFARKLQFTGSGGPSTAYLGYFRDVIQNGDGSYMLVGQKDWTTSTEPILVKISPTGGLCNINSSQTCDDGQTFVKRYYLGTSLSNPKAYRIINTSDGGYAMLFGASQFGVSHYVTLVKTDSQGTTCNIVSGTNCFNSSSRFIFSNGVSTTNFGQPSPKSLHSMTDGGYLIGSHNWIIKTNSTGGTCAYSSSTGLCSVNTPQKFSYVSPSGVSVGDVSLIYNQSGHAGYIIAGSKSFGSYLATIGLNGTRCYNSTFTDCSLPNGLFLKNYTSSDFSSINVLKEANGVSKGFLISGYSGSYSLHYPLVLRTNLTGGTCFSGSSISECRGVGGDGEIYFSQIYDSIFTNYGEFSTAYENGYGGYLVTGSVDGPNGEAEVGFVVSTTGEGLSCGSWV